MQKQALILLKQILFGASRIKLNEYNLGDKVEAINIAAVKNAKIATAGKAKVAGSMGPTGAFIEPLGELTFDRSL